MRNLLICTLFLVLFAACKNNKNENQTKDEGKPETTENIKKITKRDYSINASNSYTDLFVDSNLVENFIKEKNINDTLARRMRSFYNARNYQFAWFSSDGVTEQGRSFWNLHEYYTTYSRDNSLDDKALKKRMNALISIDTLTIKAADKSISNTEIALTQHFIQYMLDNYKSGEIKRKEMERFVPFKKEDALAQADSLLTKKHKDNKYYSDVNTSYKLLMDQLQKYDAIAKKRRLAGNSSNGEKIKKRRCIFVGIGY